ncbi:MAG: TRAP transporter large permease subunit, partial [Firmicutes bacterium]|nr:TRAP transporter large permease subunit [Bacillota bacterium]
MIRQYYQGDHRDPRDIRDGSRDDEQQAAHQGDDAHHRIHRSVQISDKSRSDADQTDDRGDQHRQRLDEGAADHDHLWVHGKHVRDQEGGDGKLRGVDAGLEGIALRDGAARVCSKGHLILPLVAIIYLMISGFTITRSALIGCVVCIIVPYLRKSTWVSPKQIVTALPQAGKSVVSVATACSTAGIIIGMVTLTGLGQRIGTGIFDLVGNNVFLALVCAMFTSLILGMGVSTTSNYLITSTIAAPILIKAGIPMLAAHMFCFYFGIVADITPPVALAAYAGSAIAKGN